MMHMAEADHAVTITVNPRNIEFPVTVAVIKYRGGNPSRHEFSNLNDALAFAATFLQRTK